jgi:two-component system, cell cycle sensor histidine kinase and response regulator CckA
MAEPGFGSLQVGLFKVSLPVNLSTLTATSFITSPVTVFFLQLFEPFFTTKEVGKGIGLGLSIVFGIIKQHNGFINVYSKPGNRTTFRILLPLIQSAVEEEHASEEVVLDKGVGTILVADDDAALRELAEKTLSMVG